MTPRKKALDERPTPSAEEMAELAEEAEQEDWELQFERDERIREAAEAETEQAKIEANNRAAAKRDAPVTDLLTVAQELLRGGQLQAERLVILAGSELGLLRAAANTAHEGARDAAKRAQDDQGSVKDYRGETNQWVVDGIARDTALATSWATISDALTAAVGIVLDRTPRPQQQTATPVARQHVVRVDMVVYLADETWRGEMRLPAVPPIGSAIRVDAVSTLRVTDVEMALDGTFTISCEPPQIGAVPSRGTLAKIGLRPGSPPSSPAR